MDPTDYRDGKFPPGRFEVYQVPIEDLESEIRMDFHSVENCTEDFRHIEDLSDVSALVLSSLGPHRRI